MKKRFFVSILAGCMLLTFGCARSGESETSDTSSEKTGMQGNLQATASADEGALPTDSSSAINDGKTTVTSGNSTANNSKTTKTTSKKTITRQTETKQTVITVAANGKSSFTPVAMRGGNTALLLKNPDRGFRMELSAAIPRIDEAILTLKVLMEQYAEDSPRIVQSYFYLTEYKDKDLDQAAMTAMQKYMDYCRKQKVQVLLRFAYVTNENTNKTEAAGTTQMLRHMDQLKPFLAKNRDVLFALEAGFVSHWGEWSGGATPERKPILEHLLDVTPSDLFVLARYTSIKNMLPDNDPRRARVGYHDDYLVGQSHRWSCGGLDGSSGYQQFLSESEDVLVQGEMPWGAQYSEPIKGMDMASRLSKLHFSVMSLYHHYKEGDGYYAMMQWKERDYTADQIKSKGLQFHPDWFLNSSGTRVNGRDMFTYIRDHLGYYLVAEKSDIEVSGRSVKATVRLKNYGFATPLTMKSCQLVIADANGKVQSAVTACDFKQLKSGKQVACTASLTLPNTKGGYYLGVLFRNHAGTSARLANETPYKNGVNLLCKIGG